MLDSSQFSLKYLQKYGWEEGEGLGKTKSGIIDAIKPKLKFDTRGFGFDPGLEYTNHWWVKHYNEALKDKTAFEEKDEKKHNCKEEIEMKKDLLDAETLFKACEGRTAHKGARHGMQLSGKLLRLESQEKDWLGKHISIDQGKFKEVTTVDKSDGRRCIGEGNKSDKKKFNTSKKKRKHDCEIIESLREKPLIDNDHLVIVHKKKKLRGK